MVTCTEWLWYRNSTGYGTMRYEGKPGVLSHRVAYCEANGVTLEAIKGIIVRHTCDNPGCVNPDHLILGSHQDNSNDMVQRGRSAREFKIPRTVVSNEQVVAIREERKNGTKLKDLGRKYGISEVHACRICLSQRR